MQSIAKQVTLALAASHKNSEIPWVFGGGTGKGEKKKEGVEGNQCVSGAELYNWEMFIVSAGMFLYSAQCVNEAVKTQRGKGTESLSSPERKLSPVCNPDWRSCRTRKDLLSTWVDCAPGSVPHRYLGLKEGKKRALFGNCEI